jgi:CRP/FNR family cyclic AMP-dependent transcriptional regulator
MYGIISAQRDLLRRSPLFSCLGDKETDAILARANVARYAAGQEIFAKGDPGNSMMAVLRGRVQISAPAADGRQMVLTIMHEGDVFGEIALLDGKERTADATALTDCELLVVPRGPFLELLERRPDIGIALLVVLCDRLRRTDERIEDLAFLDLETRIAKTLLRLAIEAETESEVFASSRFGVKISQRALGELVGGSRESVNKVLHNWKRSGIIEIERGSIVICDWDELAARV